MRREDRWTSSSSTASSVRRRTDLRAALQQRCCTLPAAHAHRHDAVARLARAHRLGDRADESRAGHAERVTDRDRAAVDVEPIHWNPETIAAVDHLTGECFVELPE